MTTKWISQIFSGGNGSKAVVTPPTIDPDEAIASNNAEGKPPVASQTPTEALTARPPATPQPSEGKPAETIDYSKFVVLLLYGKNSFGDQIYSYLRISLGGIEKLKIAMLVGNPFNPSDFGTIIAAGRGEPSDEVRSEISSQYYVMTAQTEDEAPPTAAPVTEKKSWDEY